MPRPSRASLAFASLLAALVTLAALAPTTLRAQSGGAAAHHGPATGTASVRETVVGITPEVVHDHGGLEQLQLGYPRMDGEVYTYIARFTVVRDAAFVALQQRIGPPSHGDTLRVTLVREAGQLEWHVAGVEQRAATDEAP